MYADLIVVLADTAGKVAEGPPRANRSMAAGHSAQSLSGPTAAALRAKLCALGRRMGSSVRASLLAAACLSAAPSFAAERVDRELVLAVDVSRSVWTACT